MTRHHDRPALAPHAAPQQRAGSVGTFAPSFAQGARAGGLATAALALCLLASGAVTAQVPGAATAATGSIPTPDGRAVSPAGAMVTAGDFPAAAVLAAGGTLYVADAGESPNRLVSFNTTTLAATVATRAVTSTALSGGLALSPDGGTLYAADGTGRAVEAFSPGPAPAATTSYPVPGDYVGDVAVGQSGRYLYVSEPLDHTRAYDKGQTLVRLDTTTGSVVTASVGLHPLALADGVLPGGREVVAVANRDSASVSVLDAATLSTVATVHTGSQPAALAFTDGGAHLLVVNSLDDSLVDVATATWAVAARLSLRGPRGLGAGPSALTVSHDGATVYVALSADNAVAVVSRAARANRTNLALAGRVPTGVYPTAVALDETAGQLYVTCGKGIDGPSGTGQAPGVPVMPTAQVNSGPSGLGLSGTLERIAVPGTTALQAYSTQVAADNNWQTATPISTIPAAVTHVVYIIRENKTYDEEFGDEPGGAPANLLYGRTVTPNTHALAERSALLEAFYADQEVSDTGHQAAMGATANDWVERLTQQAYGVDGAPNQDAEDGKVDDTTWAPANYLLDDALAHNITFRDYGEFYRQSQAGTGGGPTPPLQFGPAVSTALDAHIVHNFPGFGFDLSVSDTVRAAYWINDFQNDVAHHSFPALEVIYLPIDHTTGSTQNGIPQAQVANNDQATGEIVDALSHSPYWGSTAVFLTEDDPQSGIDHIDVHRTIGLAVSPWIPVQQVTTHYDQAGMLRTMEEILKLPPMTEFDATSTPMDALFSASTPNLTPFSAITPTVALPSAATQAAYHSLERRLLGAHPHLDAIPPAVQLQLQWLAVHGTPYRAYAGPRTPSGARG